MPSPLSFAILRWMDITADAPLTPRGDGVAGRAFDDVPWTPHDVLFGIFWFVGVFVAGQIAVLPLLIAFGDTSSQFFSGAFIAGAAVEVGIVVVAANFTFRRYGGGWSRLG